jgi:small GTP-binding protein
MVDPNTVMAVKVVVIGDSHTGKTSLLNRLVHGSFSPATQSTLGVDFMVKQITVDGSSIELQLWDTAGQEVFRSITRIYYRGAAGALIVYDLTIPSTFESVEGWYREIREAAGEKVAVVLIGNKSDLVQCEITEDKGEAFAKRHAIQYFQTSAKTGEGVEEALHALGAVLPRDIDDPIWQEPVITPRAGGCQC